MTNVSIEQVRISGLFGQYDYSISLHREITIITSPNGYGKTNLLKAISFFAQKKFYALRTQIVFDTLEYEFIENIVSSKHIKVFYGEDLDPEALANNYVKVFIREQDTNNDKKFDEFTQKISDCGVANLMTCIVKEETELDNEVEINEIYKNAMSLTNKK